MVADLSISSKMKRQFHDRLVLTYIMGKWWYTVEHTTNHLSTLVMVIAAVASLVITPKQFGHINNRQHFKSINWNYSSSFIRVVFS